VNPVTSTQSTPTLDTVKSFADYTHMGIDLIYQFTRAKGFPVIQAKRRGKKLIEREAAVEWLRSRTEKRG
jgi:hypothetical protein